MNISIAICTYNGEKYLQEQLESFARQTRLPDEVVVCDDKSSDGTHKILKKFAEKVFFPVKLHFNEQNFGYLKNFEKAIELCTGDVIVLSDQDDVWREDKLELFEAEFAKSEKIGMVYADAELVNESLVPLGLTMWQQMDFAVAEQQEFVNGKAFDLLLKDGYVYGSSMAFRSRYRDLILPIPLDTQFIHDNWIALMVSAVADVYLINELLVKYRQHQGQSIGMRPDKGTKLKKTINAARRTNKYEGLINQMNIAEQRLTDSSYATTKTVSKIEAVRNHLYVRTCLPKKISARLLKVSQELLKKRYHLYSNGFRSAVKDLLASKS